MAIDTLKYFLKYVQISTQSDENSTTSPSTERQKNLAKEILADLHELGYKDAYIDDFSQVILHIPGESGLKTIGLNAHMDTATDFSGEGVKPQIVSEYDGSVIKLNAKYSLDPKDFPILNSFKGKTLVTASGDTLLGADDKAGISIIMNVLKYIKDNPKFSHHPLSVMFTCDEEIGRGSEHFDNKIFKADYAYTVDGSSPFKISHENFNAASAKISIDGISVHPGDAKDKLINSNLLAVELINNLDLRYRPETTEGKEGFIHILGINGTSAHTEIEMIIRDFEETGLNAKIENILTATKIVKDKYPKADVKIEVNHQYRNMNPIFEDNKEPLLKIDKAYKALGLTYEQDPIRGGTDGATFSFLGCPTPNLGTGGYNCHGPFEFLVKEEHDLMIEVVKEIIKA